MKRPDEDIVRDSWVIVLGEMKLIGRISQAPSPSVTALCPCYELIDSKQMVQTGPGSTSLLNIVEIAPIAGCVDDVAVHIDRRVNSSPVIDVDQLSDSDRTQLRRKLAGLRENLVRARAERSGLSIVSSVPDKQH